MSNTLVQYLRTLREAHNRTQAAVADCMDVTQDHYRHIENGRRPLPDYRQGLIQWVRKFFHCVEATPEEEQWGLELMAREFVTQFIDWQTDLEQRRGNRPQR